MATVRVIPASVRKPDILRVAAYCRVSSNSEDQLHSYATQIRNYTETISHHRGWKLIDVYADEGLTGVETESRDDFNRMLSDCRKGKIDRILVKSISRFARNTRDCLVVLRELSSLGIAVYFEKENIGTDTLTTEFMVSVYSSLAQEESVSISQNQRISYQRRMERGEFITCKAPFGYRLTDKKNLEIVPEEAEIVRWIYESYLNGRSAGWIVSELTKRNIPTVDGKPHWRENVVLYILTNEKYIGDTLCQKKYTEGFPFKKQVNHGEQDQYYIEQTHVGIVPREVYQRVQEEMSRRTSKRKVMQKSAKTEQGKYSSKYAFSELLVCGECGAPYKRCTWAKNGTKRIVWRCVNRLEYGKKVCHLSPTMDEDRLQAGVVMALDRYAANPEEIIHQAMKLAGNAITGEESEDPSLLELEQRLDEVSEQQAAALDRLLDDMANVELNERLRELTEEKQRVLEQVEAARGEAVKQSNQSARLRELADRLEKQPKELTVYNDAVTRRMVERITVVNDDTLLVRIRDVDAEIEVHLPARNTKKNKEQ